MMTVVSLQKFEIPSCMENFHCRNEEKKLALCGLERDLMTISLATKKVAWRRGCPKKTERFFPVMSTSDSDIDMIGKLFGLNSFKSFRWNCCLVFLDKKSLE